MSVSFVKLKEAHVKTTRTSSDARSAQRYASSWERIFLNISEATFSSINEFRMLRALADFVFVAVAHAQSDSESLQMEQSSWIYQTHDVQICTRYHFGMRRVHPRPHLAQISLSLVTIVLHPLMLFGSIIWLHTCDRFIPICLEQSRQPILYQMRSVRL